MPKTLTTQTDRTHQVLEIQGYFNILDNAIENADNKVIENVLNKISSYNRNYTDILVCKALTYALIQKKPDALNIILNHKAFVNLQPKHVEKLVLGLLSENKKSVAALISDKIDSKFVDKSLNKISDINGNEFLSNLVTRATENKNLEALKILVNHNVFNNISPRSIADSITTLFEGGKKSTAIGILTNIDSKIVKTVLKEITHKDKNKDKILDIAEFVANTIATKNQSNEEYEKELREGKKSTLLNNIVNHEAFKAIADEDPTSLVKTLFDKGKKSTAAYVLINSGNINENILNDLSSNNKPELDIKGFLYNAIIFAVNKGDSKALETIVNHEAFKDIDYKNIAELARTIINKNKENVAVYILANTDSKIIEKILNDDKLMLHKLLDKKFLSNLVISAANQKDLKVLGTILKHDVFKKLSPEAAADLIDNLLKDNKESAAALVLANCPEKDMLIHASNDVKNFAKIFNESDKHIYREQKFEMYNLLHQYNAFALKNEDSDVKENFTKHYAHKSSHFEEKDLDKLIDAAHKLHISKKSSANKGANTAFEKFVESCEKILKSIPEKAYNSFKSVKNSLTGNSDKNKVNKARYDIPEEIQKELKLILKGHKYDENALNARETRLRTASSKAKKNKGRD